MIRIQYLPNERKLARSLSDLRDKIKNRERSFRNLQVKIRELRLKEMEYIEGITDLKTILNYGEKKLKRLIKDRTGRT